MAEIVQAANKLHLFSLPTVKRITREYRTGRNRSGGITVESSRVSLFIGSVSSIARVPEVVVWCVGSFGRTTTRSRTMDGKVDEISLKKVGRVNVPWALVLRGEGWEKTKADGEKERRKRKKMERNTKNQSQEKRRCMPGGDARVPARRWFPWWNRGMWSVCTLLAEKRYWDLNRWLARLDLVSGDRFVPSRNLASPFRATCSYR